MNVTQTFMAGRWKKKLFLEQLMSVLLQQILLSSDRATVKAFDRFSL